METLLIIFFAIWTVLCLLLFFKIWGMTNDIKELKNLIKAQSDPFTVELLSLAPGHFYTSSLGTLDYIGKDNAKKEWIFKPFDDEAKQKVTSFAGYNNETGYLRLNIEQLKSIDIRKE